MEILTVFTLSLFLIESISCDENMSMSLRSLLTVVVVLTAAPANAWNLINQVNADARQMPGTTLPVAVASGSAGAHLSGYTKYPGKVNCGGVTSCQLGPISYSQGFNGLRTVGAFGCASWGTDCWATAGTGATVNTGMTWDEAISAWVRKFGNNLYRSYGYHYSTQEGWTKLICAAWATYTPQSGNTRLYVIPGTDSCATPPIPPNQCNVLGTAVTLDHGVLKVGEITGARREQTRQVSCSRSASVRYIVSAGNPVDLGNGINSALTVNGVAAGQMINLPAGTSTLRIVSTLADKGARPGAFSKVVVLIQSFM